MKIEFSLPLSRYRRMAFRLWRSHRVLLPTVTAAELIRDDFSVRFIDAYQRGGNVNLQELLVICALAKDSDAQKIFEFGTFDGKTSATLAVNLPDAEIWTIDLRAEDLDTIEGPTSGGDRRLIEKDTIGNFHSRAGGRIHQLFGNTKSFDFSPYQGQFDFIFIDANHRYDFVLSDSRAAMSMLKPEGGVILWHDYSSLKGVTQAVHHLYESDPRFAEVKAIKKTTLAVLGR